MFVFRKHSDGWESQWITDYQKQSIRSQFTVKVEEGVELSVQVNISSSALSSTGSHSHWQLYVFLRSDCLEI